MSTALDACPFGRVALPLAVVCLLVHAWNIHLQQIANPDEPRYACPARELAEDREGEGVSTWTLPMFNGRPRLVKPILIYWALGVAGKAGQALGVDLPTAFRWVPVTCSLASVLLTFGLGRRLFGVRVGLIGAVVLLSTFSFHALGREIIIDPMLTALLLGAWCCFAAILQRLEAEPDRTPWAHLLPFYVLLGLAALAKGPPLVAIFAVCPMALYLVWERKRYMHERGKLIFALRRTGLWWGLPLAFAVAGIWVVLLHRAGRLDEVYDIMKEQNVKRAMGQFDHNDGDRVFPFIYYVYSLPAHFMPWGLLIVPAGAWLFEGLGRTTWRLVALALAVTAVFLAAARAGESFLRAHPPVAWLLCLLFAGAWSACLVARLRERAARPVAWQAKLLLCAILVPWCLMGSVGSKRTLYLLPIYPALSIWVALAWDRMFLAEGDGALRNAGLRKLWSVLLGMIAVAVAVAVVGCAAVLVLGLSKRIGLKIEFTMLEMALALVFGVALSASAILTVRDIRAGRRARAGYQALASVLVLLLAQEAVVRSATERFEDRGDFYARVSRAAGGRPLVLLGTSSNEAVWYLDRPVDDVSMPALKQAFFETHSAVLLLDEKEYRRKDKLRPSVRKLESFAYGDTEFLLVEADPAHPPDDSLFEHRRKGKHGAADEPDTTDSASEN